MSACFKRDECACGAAIRYELFRPSLYHIYNTELSHNTGILLNVFKYMFRRVKL